MIRYFRFLVLTCLLTSGSVIADQLNLRNGDAMEGEFLGINNAIIMFRTSTGVQAHPLSEVKDLTLGSTSPVVVEMAPASEKAAEKDITLPSGTRLVVRTLDTIDSSTHKAGHRFRGELEGALVIEGITVAPSGTQVHGSVISASQGGRLAGSSELSVELIDIRINDALHPIATTSLSASSGNEAKRTGGRTARGAIVGGLIDGSDGAKTGAKVGLGVSVITRGTSIHIPSGTIMETTLKLPLTVKKV
jgi:hypothetical protein